MEIVFFVDWVGAWLRLEISVMRSDAVKSLIESCICWVVDALLASTRYRAAKIGEANGNIAPKVV